MIKNNDGVIGEKKADNMEKRKVNNKISSMLYQLDLLKVSQRINAAKKKLRQMNEKLALNKI